MNKEALKNEIVHWLIILTMFTIGFFLDDIIRFIGGVIK